MEAGKLRRRITIEQQTRTDDGAGGYTEAWAAFATVWAEFEPITGGSVGQEVYKAQQIQSEFTRKIRIRYISGIKPSMRVNYNSRILRIEALLNPEERNRELLLICSEVTPAVSQ